MLILTGLFFNLNLFSGISDVSAMLEPKVRLFLSLVLSLFLPVMSYLFSEAKNIGNLGVGESAMPDDLSLKARVILGWMLLVELLRRKVDEILVQGYSGMVQRAGRVVWLGSLVFFNISLVGQKELFSIIWVLCVTRLVQRIAFAEVQKRSYAHGKNPGLISSYMAQLQHDDQVDDDQVDDIKRCRYIVMGKEKLVKKVTAYGYELNDVASTAGIITVGKVWELVDSDQMLAIFDQNQRLRRLCLSFALFKLLRPKFEQHHLAVKCAGEARDSRYLILRCLQSNGGESTAEAVFQVMNDEVNFLCEYNHSVAPVVLASPFFLLVNYVLIYIVVFGFCLMVVLICGYGDVKFALNSIFTDNFSFNSYYPAGFLDVAFCILIKAFNYPPAFFLTLDFSITVILIIIFFYEEIREFLIALLSNWFMVSLLCSYMTKPKWHGSPIFKSAFCFLMFLQRKMSNADLSFKQFSFLDLCWQPITALPTTPILSLKVKTATVPNSLKQSIIEYIAEHIRGTDHYTPLINGKRALQRNNLSHQLSWACNSNSVSEVILTWHIATSLLEVECPPRSIQEGPSFNVTTRLSKYCAYLVLFHPNLLPDNQENVELFFEDISQELKNMIGIE
nr:unnamed protein product [Digitaria exilis]